MKDDRKMGMVVGMMDCDENGGSGDSESGSWCIEFES